LRKKRLIDIIQSSIENLEEEIDQAIEEVFEWRPMWDVQKGTLEPLSNISEENNKIIVSFDLPYARKENIELNVSEGCLEVEAELNRCIKYEHWGTIQRECEFKSFHKFVKLPEKIIPDEAKAIFKDGVLTVELHKKEAKKRLKID
jgi:HSP20 family protein